MPEGHLLVRGYGEHVARPTFSIRGDRVIELAPTNVQVSEDERFGYYFVRANDEEGDSFPTSIVVVDMDGVEVLRMDIVRGDFGFRWSPSGSRLLYKVGEVVLVRDFAADELLGFQPPPGARAWEWIAGGAQILLGQGGDNETRGKLYRMDASSGDWSEISLPQDAHVGQFSSFSPNANYLAYPQPTDETTGCFYRCNLWVVELETGRTCLLAEDAPSRQYPQVVGWSSDGRWVAYYDRAIGRGELHIYDPLTCKDEVTLSDVNDFRWSSSGATLALTVKDQETFVTRLAIWKPSGGLQQLDLEVSSPQVWSPDGTTIATNIEHGLLLVDGESRTTTEIPLADPTTHSERPDLAWSPSGRYVLASYSASYRREPSGSWVFVIDTQTGVASEFLRHPTELHELSWVP